MHRTVPASNATQRLHVPASPLTLSSAERIELAEYMRFAHESIVATINDARRSKRTSALLMSQLQAYADSAAALASRLAR